MQVDAARVIVVKSWFRSCNAYLLVRNQVTRSQAVARIADCTAKNCSVTWRRPHPLSGKFICAPARHFRYKAVYQIWSL